MASFPNIWLCKTEEELERNFGTADFFIAHIDGARTITLRQFYEEIADILEFPVTAYSLDALNDALNDLQWLEDERIVLYMTDTALLVSKERDPVKLNSLLQLLDATAEDWKWVEPDEQFDRKTLTIVFEESDRIRQTLESESIAYGNLAERRKA